MAKPRYAKDTRARWRGERGDAPNAAEYPQLYQPPEGYDWVGECREPRAGEYWIADDGGVLDGQWDAVRPILRRLKKGERPTFGLPEEPQIEDTREPWRKGLSGEAPDAPDYPRLYQPPPGYDWTGEYRPPNYEACVSDGGNVMIGARLINSRPILRKLAPGEQPTLKYVVQTEEAEDTRRPWDNTSGANDDASEYPRLYQPPPGYDWTGECRQPVQGDSFVNTAGAVTADANMPAQGIVRPILRKLEPGEKPSYAPPPKKMVAVIKGEVKVSVRNTQPRPPIQVPGATKRKIPARLPISKASLAALPEAMKAIIAQATADPAMNDGVLALYKRAEAFSSRTAAVLAGLSLNPMARKWIDEQLHVDARSLKEELDGNFDEVIIGGGLHAAIYATVRVAKGFPAPLILEASERMGGTFAMSWEPSFYLNSRNRPGDLSLPRTRGALNVIPGAMLQPADLGGDEYQTNSTMAWAICMALSMYGRVAVNADVISIEDAGGRYRYLLELASGEMLGAARVIIATGVGNPRSLQGQAGSDRAMTFAQFMQRMDDPFPLRGMKRVAVIGAGDSGRTAIEALTGQGPTTRWSVASLDYPEQIDWYGLAPGAGTRGGWLDCNRSRYKGIARLLPRSDSPAPARVTPKAGRPTSLSPGYECVYVNEQPYDFVIVCIGYEPGITVEQPYRLGNYQIGARLVAKRSQNIFAVGPAAELDVSELERNATGDLYKVPENATALFRYGSRTATLASSLGGIN